MPGQYRSAEDGASTSQVDRAANLIHCAFLSLTMAFRPLLRQVSSFIDRYRASIDVSQRAVVPAITAAVTTGFVFAPRTIDAEERPEDLLVRLSTSACDERPCKHQV